MSENFDETLEISESGPAAQLASLADIRIDSEPQYATVEKRPTEANIVTTKIWWDIINVSIKEVALSVKNEVPLLC